MQQQQGDQTHQQYPPQYYRTNLPQRVFNCDTIQNYDDISVAQPPEVKTPLRVHQLAALQRSLKLELDDFEDLQVGQDQLRSSMGVLGDKVGSGKSLLILALVATRKLVLQKKQMHTIYDRGMITSLYWRKSTQSIVLPVSLLVIPHGLQRQWKAYVEEHLVRNTESSLRVSLLFKTASITDLRGEKMSTLLNSSDLIIVTSTMHKLFYMRFVEYSLETYATDDKLYFSRYIIDEADIVPGNRRFFASFYWFVTSSVMNLIYPRGYWRSVNSRNALSGYAQGTAASALMTSGGASRSDSSISTFDLQHISGIRHNGFVLNSFVEVKWSEHIVNKLIVKNSDHVVDESFELPLMLTRILICKTPNMISIIEGFVPPDIMGLIMSGNVEDAIERIASEKTEEKNVVEVLTRRTHEELVNCRLELDMKVKMQFPNAKQRALAIEKAEIKVKELERKIELIGERTRDALQDYCLYCRSDDIEKPTIVQCCQKAFCFQCIATWLNAKKWCPNCKSECTMKELVVLTTNIPSCSSLESEKQNQTEVREMKSKIENIRDILAANPNGKFLIFAAWDNSFNLVARLLYEMEMTYCLLRGSGNRIQKSIDDYKRADSRLNVLLLNSTYMGSGLNLENTTDIIIYHQMDKGMEKQVIGRGQRFGRKEPLRVWKLLYENEEGNVPAS